MRVNAKFGYVLHFVAFVVNSIGFVFGTFFAVDHNGVANIFAYRGWPGKLKYLTYWSEVIQFLYFAVAILNDIYEGNKSCAKPEQSKLHKFRDAFHASVAFPVAVVSVH